MTAWRRRPAALAGVVVLLLGLGGLVAWLARDRGPTGIHKIEHVVIVMQENRSFDSYFGTFPGADGIPMQNGRPTVCLPDPATGSCDQPYLEKADRNAGCPHGSANAVAEPPVADAGLLAVMGHDPVDVDSLCTRAGLTAEQVAAQLLRLELDGRVTAMPGGLYQRLEKAHRG